MSATHGPKTKPRPAYTYCIYEKSETDYRAMHGNKIVSRHSTEQEARAALNAIFSKKH
jgi:hypothetical protein